MVDNCSQKSLRKFIKVFSGFEPSRNYAIFSATIVASESEQENDFPKKSKEKLTYIPIIEKNEIVLTGNEELDPPDQLDLNLE